MISKANRPVVCPSGTKGFQLIQQVAVTAVPLTPELPRDCCWTPAFLHGCPSTLQHDTTHIHTHRLSVISLSPAFTFRAADNNKKHTQKYTHKRAGVKMMRYKLYCWTHSTVLFIAQPEVCFSHHYKCNLNRELVHSLFSYTLSL